MHAKSLILALTTLVTVASTGFAAAQQRLVYRASPPEQTYDVTTMGRLPTPPGGVPGNAPFNNQIRKHTAPFEANGAGR